MDDETQTYQHAMFYTVELASLITFEVRTLVDAVGLFERLMAATTDSDVGLNLVVWAGRNLNGGPPVGYILRQWSWRQD